MRKRVEKLRDLGTPELEVQEKELGEQIFRLRFQLTTGQSEALARLRSARKELSRVKTLLREREIKLKVGNGKR